MTSPLKKTPLPVAAASLGGAPDMEKLKAQQKNVEQELARARVEAQQVKREQDESTNVFDLRKTRSVLEVEDLEEKKGRLEKEINALLVLKNARAHQDLQSATRLLSEKTQSMAPLEKELEAGVAKIFAIKHELQNFFETQYAERRLQRETLESSGREMAALRERMAEAQGFFSGTLQTMVKQHTQVEEEWHDLRRRHSEVSAKLIADEGRLQALEELRKTALSQLETLNTRLPNLVETKTELETSIHETRIAREKALLEKQAFENAVESLREQRERLAGERDQLEAEVGRLRTRVALLSEELTNKELKCRAFEVRESATAHRTQSLEVAAQQAMDAQALAQSHFNKTDELERETLTRMSGLTEREVELKASVLSLENRLAWLEKNVSDTQYQQAEKEARLQEQEQTMLSLHRQRCELAETEFVQRQQRLDWELRQREEADRRKLDEQWRSNVHQHRRRIARKIITAVSLVTEEKKAVIRKQVNGLLDEIDQPLPAWLNWAYGAGAMLLLIGAWSLGKFI